MCVIAHFQRLVCSNSTDSGSNSFVYHRTGAFGIIRLVAWAVAGGAWQNVKAAAK